MLSGQLSDFLRHVRRFVGASGDGDLTDRQLLERFTFHRDEAAFEALVQRHGPLVYRVCVRVLSDAEDAADAFQATFLVLARKAASVRKHEALGSWLYGVAYRIALKARIREGQRRERQREVIPMAAVDPETEAARRELRLVLDEELLKLPEKYRAPLVLCYLEGKTNEEAARQLGWTKGTVSGRLARARDLLRGRLARRGVAIASVAVAQALVEEAPAAVPAALVGVTVKAASVFAADPMAAAGAISPVAAELARGALRTMSISRMKMALAMLLAVAIVGGGAGAIGRQVLAAKPRQPDVPAGRPGEADPRVAAAPAPLALTTQHFADKLNLGGNGRNVYRIGLKAKFDDKGGGSGELDLDPNRCTYTEFGDIGGMTEIFARPVAVTLKQLDVEDPAGKGRRLYEVQGDGLPARLMLVYSRGSARHRLLVMDTDGKTVKYVFPLE